MGISVRTVYKWRRRYRAEGIAGLQARSSRPHTSTDKTPDDVETTVIALRKERRIYHRIAAETGLSKSTVGRILTCHGLNQWRDLEPYTPKTNGKAERFIQSPLREWAYATAYETSDHRAEDLPHWLHHYNWHRPHAKDKRKITHQPSRLGCEQPHEAPQIDLHNTSFMRKGVSIAKLVSINSHSPIGKIGQGQ